MKLVATNQIKSMGILFSINCKLHTFVGRKIFFIWLEQYIYFHPDRESYDLDCNLQWASCSSFIYSLFKCKPDSSTGCKVEYMKISTVSEMCEVKTIVYQIKKELYQRKKYAVMLINVPTKRCWCICFISKQICRTC